MVGLSFICHSNNVSSPGSLVLDLKDDDAGRWSAPPPKSLGTKPILAISREVFEYNVSSYEVTV